MDDLQEVIHIGQAAVDATLEDHPDRARRLHNLGVGLGDRYSRTGGHIAKFCRKKSSPQASPKQVVTCMQTVPCRFTSLGPKALASCTLNAEFPESSIQKIIIDSGATDHFFSNRAYFSTYEEHHHGFQTGSGEVLTAYGYGDVVLRLAHPDVSEVVWTTTKVS